MTGLDLSVDVSDACIDFDVDITLDDLSIVFPGGLELKIAGVAGVDVAFAADYAKQFLASASAALAPLQPIFNIIELLLVLVEFAQAVPDSLGPPPDPTKIIKLIPKLKKKLDKLLAMIPPLSIPKFIKDLIRLIIVFLKGLKASLKAVVDLNVKIDLGLGRLGELQGLAAEGKVSIDLSIELQASLDCALDASLAMCAGIAQDAQPLNTLLGIIRAFVQLVGLPIEIPDLSHFGAEVSVAIDAIDVLLLLLTNVHAAIVI